MTFTTFYKGLVPFHIRMVIWPKALEAIMLYPPFSWYRTKCGTHTHVDAFMGHDMYGGYLIIEI